MNHVQHQLTQGDDAQLLIFQEVCLAAVRQNGRALRHASETQRNNKEVVDAALENCTEAQLWGGPWRPQSTQKGENVVESRQDSARNRCFFKKHLLGFSQYVQNWSYD